MLTTEATSSEAALGPSRWVQKVPVYTILGTSVAFAGAPSAVATEPVWVLAAPNRLVSVASTPKHAHTAPV